MITLKELEQAVRGARSLTELTQLVGPSEEENQAAGERLKRLDAIEEFCNWDSPSPTMKEDRARKEWRRIMREQNEFEERYC